MQAHISVLTKTALKYFLRHLRFLWTSTDYGIGCIIFLAITGNSGTISFELSPGFWVFTLDWQNQDFMDLAWSLQSKFRLFWTLVPDLGNSSVTNLCMLFMFPAHFLLFWYLATIQSCLSFSPWVFPCWLDEHSSVDHKGVGNLGARKCSVGSCECAWTLL